MQTCIFSAKVKTIWFCFPSQPLKQCSVSPILIAIRIFPAAIKLWYVGYWKAVGFIQIIGNSSLFRAEGEKLNRQPEPCPIWLFIHVALWENRNNSKNKSTPQFPNREVGGEVSWDVLCARNSPWICLGTEHSEQARAKSPLAFRKQKKKGSAVPEPREVGWVGLIPGETTSFLHTWLCSWPSLPPLISWHDPAKLGGEKQKRPRFSAKFVPQIPASCSAVAVGAFPDFL